MDLPLPINSADLKPGRTDRQGKTYVLIHGAWHGGWCWKSVAGHLRALGHTVYTPTQTGLGDRSHLLWTKPTMETFIEDVAQVFKYEQLDDVILVGHSFGGSTVSALADRLPDRLRHLVYIDAMLLHPGESVADRVAHERWERYAQRAIERDGTLSIPPNDADYYGVTDREMATWLLTRLTPQPFQTFLDKLQLRNPIGNRLPATYIACTNPPFAANAKSREIARSISGWGFLEIPTGHDAMILMPRELAEMLAEIG